MDQEIKDHLGFNKEGLIYLIGVLVSVFGLLLAAFFNIWWIAVDFLGLFLIVVTIIMNFKERSHISIKVAGIFMKFAVLAVFVVITVFALIFLV